MPCPARSLGCTLMVLAGGLQAGELGGFVGIDSRFFTKSPAFAEQNSSFADPSVFVQPEFRHEWNDGSDRFTTIPFARYDSLDSNRSHWDIREFNWLHQGDNWSLQAGVNKVFWGVAESHHLIDIVNQTDFVENINSEDKLGQPMVNFNVSSPTYGNFNFMYLPYFRERTFPAANGRVRFVFPVNSDNQDMNGISHWHPDWAVRWSKTFGDWDLGIAHFNGISREPRLPVSIPASVINRIRARFPDGNIPNRLDQFPPDLADAIKQSSSFIPTYDIIHQTSLDLQGAVGNWLLKLEAMTRSGQGERFYAAVGGFEYTHYGIFDTSADLGLLMEYQYDSRKQALVSNPTVPPTASDNDLFLGARLTLNDPQSSQLLVGTMIDTKTQATVATVEASRRLGDNWKLELEARFFGNIPNSDILAGYQKDDYFQLRIVRYLSDLNPSPKPAPTLTAAVEPATPAPHVKDKQPIQPPQSVTPATQPKADNQANADETEVLNRLKNWAESWSSGNVTDYLSYYATDFKPDDQTSHDNWKTSRLGKVNKNKGIRVKLSEIRTRVDAKNKTINTVFKQDYLSNDYISSTLKEIIWQKAGDKWLIVEEKTLEDLPVSTDLMQQWGFID